MPIQQISIEEFIKMEPSTFLLLDVRSPSEYIHAHIPLALNLPLFIDEERKIVGTAYKQESKEKAIKLGLNFFGPKMSEMIEAVEKLIAENKVLRKIKDHQNISIVVHCWRGGMRSAGVAWLLDLYGFKVFTIIGGYKAYRNWTLKQFNFTYQFKVIGGYTGSGKTEIITTLKKMGMPIVDLEGLANHKGSAFGNLNAIQQPSQEMFENLLGMELYKLKDECIIVEDESQRIGDINLPIQLFNNKQSSPIFFLDIPFEERLKYILRDYSKNSKEKLVNAIMRIKKRLGGLDAKNAINFLLEDDIEKCFAILLKYYDKHYLKGLQSNENSNQLFTTIQCDTVDAVANTEALLSML